MSAIRGHGGNVGPITIGSAHTFPAEAMASVFSYKTLSRIADDVGGSFANKFVQLALTVIIWGLFYD